MPRPFRLRKVCCRPDSNYFKPRGIPVDVLEEVNLTIDEFEAIRLADLEELYQEDAAKKMGISRQTFGNIITCAHKKVADSLINSKALKIEGGAVKMMEKHFVCYECKHEWATAFGTGRPNECPQCKSVNIHRAAQERGWARGRGFASGRGFAGACRRE